MTGALADDWFPRSLPAGFHMGQRCFLYSAFSFLHCPSNAENEVRIGDDTGVYHGSFFELGPRARVEIGKFCTLVGPILRVEREVSVGNYVFIAHEVVISDCDGPGEAQFKSSLCRGKTERVAPASCEPRPVRIEDDVWIGMRAIILAGVTIGAGAIVGAGAVVSEDVPPMTIVSGNPAKVVRVLSEHGSGRKT